MLKITLSGISKAIITTVVTTSFSRRNAERSRTLRFYPLHERENKMSISGQRLLSFISVLALCLTGAMYGGASAQAKNMDTSNKASAHAKSLQATTSHRYEDICTPKPDDPPDDPSPDAPDARNDCYVVYPGVHEYLYVLGNDLDPLGGGLKVCDYEQPANGEAVVGPKADVDVAVKNSATGSFDFVYYACNSAGLMDSATVTMVVKPVIRLKPVKLQTAGRKFRVTNYNDDSVLFSFNLDSKTVDRKVIGPGVTKTLFSRGKKMRWIAAIGESYGFAGKGVLRYD